MTDTEVVEAPDTEPAPEAPDDEDLTADDDLEPDEAPEAIAGPDEEEYVLAAAQTEKEIEKRSKALEKEAERHDKRIRELLGDDFEGIVKCEACPENIAGYHYSAEYFPPGTDEHSLYVMLGSESVKPMRQPDYLVVCDECNGHGEVLTGSVANLTRTIPCPVCKLTGYIDTREASPPPAIPDLPSPEVSSVAPAAATDELERDMWGRPRGHAHFGTFPIYLSDAERASDLAEGFAVE